MKKLLSLFTAFALVLTLAGCGEEKPVEPTEKTIKVAALESAYGQDAWKAVAEAFTAETGIKVDLIMDKNLEDVIGPDMKAGNFPDVIHCGYGRPAALTETFTKDSNLRVLENALNTIKIPGEDVTAASKIAGGFLDSSFARPYSDSKIYTAPMFYSPCGLFYNANLFETKGWELPTTWDEMWELGDKAKAEGIALFAYPTTGYFDAFTYALLNVVGGPEFFNAATTYEEGVWQTEEGQTTLDIIAKLATYTHETVPANANNDNFRKNQQLVLDNQALFMPNGNWVIGEMKDAPRAEGFEWGMMALPALEEGSDRYSYTFYEQAWSPKACPNPAEADQFIAFLYSDKAVEIFVTKGSAPAVQPVNGVSELLDGDNKIYYSIYETGAKASMGGFAATEQVEGVNIADEMFGSVNSLVNGSMTREEYENRVTEASDALRPALKK